MWRKYFTIKGIKPGPVVFPAPFNKVDLRRNDLDPDMLRRMYEADLPYIKMTEEGLEHFYSDKVLELRYKNDDELFNAANNAEETESLFTAKDLVAKIKDAETEEQARYFYGLGKQYKSVKQAFNKKLQVF
ncbi:MAG: hypothetical protein A2X13_14675 [Bacteroidetes bacterium GWC2_33_15]|nr:MAG: hypothetical protein A2X10_06740 [Bacteroidetes bacterium GWA2_33_15]OFX50117.1 MAG: hypothetical protein A2X13_14675 [Bacteroidetes bacterium GWC2_33_15]OFX65270.1 MAG: hypothetical protein A2X15_04250 [Bacteroidetes bacterium GWB2_32_14]OFX70496.1 MAG: hypothetical protein A2X14_04305 [Bacteroidetes bacterium GWD2_33_33]HAN19631.1 hypothetical protein [Bacteroidales bacterium]